MSDSANITFAELVDSTGGELLARGTATRFDGGVLDGRAVRPGDIYFAILGDTLDGHDYCAQAVAAGATGLVVMKGTTKPLPDAPGVTIVAVDDTRRAMGRLARVVRRRSRAKIVGITGSSGKTTTKELCAAMLAGVAGANAVLASEGSLNNETGVPLTLLRLRPRHEFAVVEMGMRGRGHIAYLTQWAEPEVGVVLNAGNAHVGVVGSVDAIAAGKSEIWGGLPAHGRAIYPRGDERLATRALEQVPADRHITFGEEEGATVRIERIVPLGADGSEMTVHIAGRALHVRVPLVGRHNASNAAAALAVAVALGVDLDRAVAGIANARPASARSELQEIGGRRVLVDCYNANPASMRAAIQTLAELGDRARAVAVLGDMLELGDSEGDEHERIGFVLKSSGVEKVIAVGERARRIAVGARKAGVKDVLETDDPRTAAQALTSWTDRGDWILVKASRGMRLERVLDELRNLLPPSANKGSK